MPWLRCAGAVRRALARAARAGARDRARRVGSTPGGAGAGAMRRARRAARRDADDVRAIDSPTSSTSSRRARSRAGRATRASSTGRASRSRAGASAAVAKARAATSCSCAGRSRRCGGRASRRAIVDAARRLGVRQAVTLGGIPSLVSHRKATVRHDVGDAALARAGARARCAPTTRARPGCRPSCSARSATPASRAPGCGRRCRSTCRARRRRPRSARCSRAWSRCTTSISICGRSTSAARRTCAGSRPGLEARPDVKAVVDQIDERQEGTDRRPRRRDRAVPPLAVRRRRSLSDSTRHELRAARSADAPTYPPDGRRRHVRASRLPGGRST